MSQCFNCKEMRHLARAQKQVNKSFSIVNKKGIQQRNALNNQFATTVKMKDTLLKNAPTKLKEEEDKTEFAAINVMELVIWLRNVLALM